MQMQLFNSMLKSNQGVNLQYQQVPLLYQQLAFQGNMPNNNFISIPMTFMNQNAMQNFMSQSQQSKPQNNQPAQKTTPQPKAPTVPAQQSEENLGKGKKAFQKKEEKVQQKVELVNEKRK